MSSLQRRPVLSHPLADLGGRDEAPQAKTPATDAKTTATTEPARKRAPRKTAPAASASVEAPPVQMNARIPGDLRRQLRTAAAGMTAATGERVSQDQIVRDALEYYLPTLYATHNNGRPFGPAD